VPWSETSPMDQRRAFVWECEQQWWSMTELCARYGISRKTGYQWRGRAQRGEGVEERSRRPHHCPHAIPDAIVERIVAFRRAHRRWGPKKLRRELQRRDPTTVWPARSTISLLLKRHGLVVTPRRRVRPGHAGRPLTPIHAANAVWSIDFKGYFRTGDGQVCHPLTVTDGFSRFLLACDAFAHPTTGATRRTLERVFREYGLPAVLRSDNGAPFAGTGLARLSRLAVWWIRLGIRPELIEPASPQQNGRHERMHRTLKAETAQPAAPSRAAQARRFDRFRARYNFARPHEGIGLAYPSALYMPSSRPFPSALPEVVYPAAWTPRHVYGSGEMDWRGQRIWVSGVLADQTIALDECADGYWSVYFGPVLIGVFDERRRRIRPKPLLAKVTEGARVLTHARAE
jgi:putative transposase